MKPLLQNILLTTGVLSFSACASPRSQPKTPEAQPLPANFNKKPLKKVGPVYQSTKPVAIAAQSANQAQSILPNKLHSFTHKNIKLNIVSFDSREFSLNVADQKNGPGSIWSSAGQAAKSESAVAAINAGFFTPEGIPLGLVIDDGVKRGSYNLSSLGAGIFFHTKGGLAISRKSHWKNLSRTPPAHLLQSGPMLVENKNAVKGLSKKNSRPRSFIATDGAYHWCIGHAENSTLAELGNALSTLSSQGFKIKTALNLDGGRSSDLWVSPSVKGGPLSIRPFWNKSVRNFLVLKKK